MSGSGPVVESSQARFLLPHNYIFLKSKQGPRQPNYMNGAGSATEERIRHADVPDPSPPSTDPALSAPLSKTFQVTDIPGAPGAPGPGSYPTITPDGPGAIRVTGLDRPKIREPEGRMALGAMLHPDPREAIEPRGPFEPDLSGCAYMSRGGGWCTGGCTPLDMPPGHVQGVPHPVPHHPPLLMDAHPLDPARNGPLGSTASRGARCAGNTGNTREYTGIHGTHGVTVYCTGIHGNTRNTRNTPDPGIPGNTRNTRNTREYTGLPGIPVIHGNTREYR